LEKSPPSQGVEQDTGSTLRVGLMKVYGESGNKQGPLESMLAGGKLRRGMKLERDVEGSRIFRRGRRIKPQKRRGRNSRETNDDRGINRNFRKGSERVAGYVGG